MLTPAGLRLSVERYSPGAVLPEHSHPFTFVSLVTRGHVFEGTRGREEMRTAGDVRILPEGVTHANRYGDTGATCLVIRCSPTSLRWLETADVKLQGSSHLVSTPVSSLAERIRQESTRADSLSGHSIDAMVTELLVATARLSASWVTDRHERVRPQWLTRIHSYIHDVAPHVPHLAELAGLVHMHPSYLLREFRRSYGLTPTAYAAKLRLARAHQLIVTTAIPLAEVAHSSGFSDQAHMTRQFRLGYGITPARHRRALAGKSDGLPVD
ncbi:MAG: AraC family transcriptional regulator [Gemmatimonadaceae bacterium]